MLKRIKKMLWKKCSQRDKSKRNGRGQTTVEYAVLLTVVAMALITMFTYIRSAMAHRMKSGVDGMGRGMLYTPDSEVQNPVP